MNWKSKKLWIVLVSIGLVGWWAFRGSGGTGQYPVQVANVPPSNFAAVAKGKIDIDGGIIEVAARSAGIFREIYVEEGDRVEAGQVLAVQEDDEQQIALRQSEAQLISANAQLDRLMVRQEIAEREYQRLKPLVEIDAASPQELDRAQDEIRQIEVDLVAQEASILQAEANVESARFRLEQRKVRAPVAGRIIEAKARPGVGASTFQVSTAFTLMPEAQKIVRADLDESFVGNVVIGQKATVSPDARPQESYEGEVIRISEIFGRRTTQDATRQGGGANDHVIEVVVGVGDVPLLIGQRVLVRFEKEGGDAG